ncbi:unnamed protein product [Periconia digitata]|uniref:Uncharacterized protein n=1 Tax=Periconia digitata TaxID=1303443 RepID=A0A9W4URQ6_9PLEO|nr:unnamed protein product [Periconia digitata]
MCGVYGCCSRYRSNCWLKKVVGGLVCRWSGRQGIEMLLQRDGRDCMSCLRREVCCKRL